MKVAQVIVDAALMQTDKPFSYAISKDLEEDVLLGSRVHVPFGAGNRLLQGFVVGFKEQVDSSQSLKEIAEVLDPEPVLNEEQLALADAMRKTVFSYKISILKSMLPSLLNSQYDKLFSVTDETPQDVIDSAFSGQASVRYSEVSDAQKQLLTRLARQKKVALDYLAKDKKTVKTQKYYQVNSAILASLEISQRAKKRQALKEYLETSPKGKLSDLREKYSRDVVQFFIEAQAITLSERLVNRADSYFETVEKTDFLTLNDEQQAIVETVSVAIGKDSTPFLLEGVTGSGKTEVYLHIIDKVLKQGKTAIVLVPEISLTPQMTHRFISRFGKQVAIMHSGLSDGEKYDEWRKIKSGKARVVVGARSAIFSPLDNIGAIIIDEEHEASYKQESNPRYHARDVAILRAKYHKAVVVLGSATPSIESRARASRKVYHFLQLTKRANPKASLPQVEIADFRDYLGQKSPSNYTPLLLEKIANRLERGEQSVLMLNRRGYSSFIMCRECAYVDNCPNCDISLTLHMDTKTMNCHYCGFTKAIPRTCPNCNSRSIAYYGTGTQKAYDELQEVFPQARILRMDVDTTRKKGAHEKILRAFGKGEADILLGTQMIAKGLDFPNVTLVGVLNADTSLNLPDFRSSERTFQLLTQVAGRAGRGDKSGEVVIQTYNPDHYAIQLAKQQDYETFYRYEMNVRKQMSYPPYYYTVGITLSLADELELTRKAYQVLAMLKEALSPEAKLLGPTPKPIARTHNLYHYHIIIKYRFEDNLETVLNRILDWTQEKDNKKLRVQIDNEPQNI
ncbi:primosomal protein N' [Streptococcus hyointestinalis]|uniref:Replication restart protein PriA n=1 Tax=Streptococcus hyointestinalis TaxID=1337 RepID=A0A380K846_9STRE|nr:primosomal protein N' [Streptococcus hyointestinalis]SUN60306.1 primosomal protein N' [Streptococcus hyointestinalis]